MPIFTAYSGKKGSLSVVWAAVCCSRMQMRQQLELSVSGNTMLEYFTHQNSGSLVLVKFALFDILSWAFCNVWGQNGKWHIRNVICSVPEGNISINFVGHIIILICCNNTQQRYIRYSHGLRPNSHFVYFEINLFTYFWCSHIKRTRKNQTYL